MDDANPELQDQDESVRIAVRALGDMRNNAQRADLPDTNSPFVSRMSHIPLVNSALSLYEQGKASSRVVKYGAEMMECSVKTISRPVIERLPVNVNQLDEFACRQLDRLDKYRRPSTSDSATPTSPSSSHPMSAITHTDESNPLEPKDPGLPKVKLKAEETSAVEDESQASTSTELDDFGHRKGWKGKTSSRLQASSPFVGPAPPPLESSSSSTPPQAEERQVAQRSRWQAVLLEAGGLSAALSEESLRRLKYCLEWLQYATAHIDAQILILRDFTASLQPLPSQTRAPHPPISQAHMRTLIAVRRDIVHTVKQVVDVVSRYAGGALPEPARGRVRGFILDLPQRWARKAGPTGPVAREEDVERDRERERDLTNAASGSGTGPVRRNNRRGRERGPGAGSAPSSRATSPMARHTRHQDENGDPISASTAIVTAQRILTLATESLDMMRGVTGVVKDSLDRADAWVGRFRTVGLQRGERTEDSASSSSRGQPVDDAEMELDFTNLRHRRVASFGSQLDEGDAMPSPYSGTSSYSSYAGGSSVPSTPGAGSHTPVYPYSQSVGGAASPIHMGLGLSSMTIGSAYGTPRSLVGVLPDDVGEPADEGDVPPNTGRKEQSVEEVKIAGMDVEGDVEDGTAPREDAVSRNMDVDT
ncbi:hypothetical protein H0H87_008797 [Tephrocybe sp. NHM501043]|nr:hypothetical protein H0H87_008797 [Tephrocybe sp. NHM501043]